MATIAGREVRTPDLVLLGTGVLALVDLFLPWYRITEDQASEISSEEEALDVIDFFGSAAAGASEDASSISLDAFGAGFLAWFPTLLLVVVAALVAARVFGGLTPPSAGPVGPALVPLALSALAAVLLVLKLLVDPDYVFLGLFVALVLALVQAASSFGAFKRSGESLPDLGRGGPGAPPAPPTA